MEIHCPQCMQLLDESQFYRNNARPNGRAGWCKQCYLEARDKSRINRIVVQFSYVKGRAQFSMRLRKKYDRMAKRCAGLYFVVGGEVYRWGNWRKAVTTDLNAFVQQQAIEGRKVDYL